MLGKTPAVLIGEHVVKGLRGMVSEDELARLQHALEEVQERLAEEWPNVG